MALPEVGNTAVCQWFIGLEVVSWNNIPKHIPLMFNQKLSTRFEMIQHVAETRLSEMFRLKKENRLLWVLCFIQLIFLIVLWGQTEQLKTQQTQTQTQENK